MHITHQIETDNEILTVEFEGHPTWENDSYSDERGYVERKPYASMQTFPTWDKTLFSQAQNEAIENYVLDIKTSSRLLDKFCRALKVEMEFADY